MARPTMPAPATATATGKRRTRATWRVPTVDSGVAAGDSAARAASPTAVGGGRRNKSGRTAQPSTPTAMSRPSSVDDGRGSDSSSPMIVATTREATAAVATATTAAGGGRSGEHRSLVTAVVDFLSFMQQRLGRDGPAPTPTKVDS